MALTLTEFETMLGDATKRIEGDIVWQEDEDHSPCLEFRAEIQSGSGWPLFVIRKPTHPRTSRRRPVTRWRSGFNSVPRHRLAIMAG